MHAHSPTPPKIFDRISFRQQRNRSAAKFTDHDFIFSRVIKDLILRLELTNRDFDHALFYGTTSPSISLSDLLTNRCSVNTYIEADIAYRRLDITKKNGVVYDDEILPFRPQTFDLIISNLTLHAANDLVGALSQLRTCLKPDGLLIATLFGENTLKHFKKIFVASEAQATNAIQSRFSPFATIQGLGNILQRSGYTLPVVDVDNIAVSYSEPMNLLKDLRGMGEANYLATRTNFVSKDILTSALTQFHDTGGRVNFDVVTLTGWEPHESQQKPLQPGSATKTLQNAVLKSQ